MSPDVLTERAPIQAEIEGRTLVDALADTVAASLTTRRTPTSTTSRRASPGGR